MLKRLIVITGLAVSLATSILILPAQAATLFSTISTTTCYGYGQSANSLRTAIPFTTPSAAILTGFDLKFSGSATSYMSVKIYNNNSGVNGPTLIGTFTYASLNGQIASYSGNISVAGSTTYWLYFQSSSYTTPCYSMTPSTSGSSSGWIVGGKARESFDSGTTWTTRSDNLNFLYSIYGDPVVADTTPPTFPSADTFNIAENTTSVGTVATSESATITIFGGEDQAKFSISRLTDSSTALSFLSAPNYEAPTDVGANNTYVVVFKAVDGAANIGYETVTVTVTDVVDTSSFNSFAIAAAPAFRTVVQVSANISVPAKVTFKVNNVRIPGCIGLRTTGTAPNIVATCNWKPSKRGTNVITAVATPTTAGIATSTSTVLTMNVDRRKGTR